MVQEKFPVRLVWKLLNKCLLSLSAADVQSWDFTPSRVQYLIIINIIIRHISWTQVRESLILVGVTDNQGGFEA